jgi:Holliday junction resolvase RusA-like endonuclease
MRNNIILENMRATSVNNIYRRTRNGKVFKSSPHKNFCEGIKEFIKEKDIECCDKDMKVSIEFYMKGKRRSDIDNMCKSLIDALQGVCWTNDNLITELNLKRFINQKENKILVGYEELCCPTII